ncbi:MAG TPA: hypothetical protein VM692_02465 [Gammaproteobacteria bacterium]|nr:hypothetical protein [Gammaproteobacteria bacterium]
MRRRLPHEPAHLIEQLTIWIEWRYADSHESLVLTSAPTSVPLAVNRWLPGAVWRLAWQGDGSAVLYGISPGSAPNKYFVARHDGVASRREGLFERVGDEHWVHLDGDSLRSLRAALAA